MLYNINKYNLLEEMTKWKEKYRDGNISEKGLKKIKQAGIAKNESQLADGVNRGTDALMRKQAPDFTINRNANTPFGTFFQTGGAYMDPTTKTINNDSLKNPIKHVLFPFSKVIPTTKNKQSNDLANALALRHEAYEAIDYAKDPNRWGGDGFFRGKHSRQYVGKHMSADVLNKEAKDVNDLSYTNASKVFTKTRQKTGEAESIKKATGVNYTKVNNQNVGANTKKIKDHEKSRFSDAYTTDDSAQMAKELAALGGLGLGSFYLTT